MKISHVKDDKYKRLFHGNVIIMDLLLLFCLCFDHTYHALVRKCAAYIISMQFKHAKLAVFIGKQYWQTCVNRVKVHFQRRNIVRWVRRLVKHCLVIC